MQVDQKQIIADRIAKAIKDPVDLYNEIESIELDPLLNIFTDEHRNLQLLAKWAAGDYFGLRMLLKRIKPSKGEPSPLLRFFSTIEVNERQLNLSELIKIVSTGSELFPSHRDLYQLGVTTTERHILSIIGQYYTCFDLKELSAIYNRSIEQTTELAKLNGYDVQDNWVKFPLKKINTAKLSDKQLLKRKQLELTQLSSILSVVK